VHAPITPSDGLKNYVDELVEASSAGCLVFRQMKDFAAFMSICHKAKAIWGNSFTLTLIKDTDLTGGLTLDPVSPVPVREEVSGFKSHVSKEGLDLIRHFESCLKPVGGGWFEAYPDPAHGWRVPTIGWGTIAYEDGKSVMRGDRISQTRADELLAWESAEKVRGVLALVNVPLNDDQLAALVSFAYNVGLGNFKGSTMLRLLNAGDYGGAAEQFPRWNKADNQVMRGLTRRRLSEQKLFRGERPFIVPA
jgi:lysozyme